LEFARFDRFFAFGSRLRGMSDIGIGGVLSRARI